MDSGVLGSRLLEAITSSARLGCAGLVVVVSTGCSEPPLTRPTSPALGRHEQRESSSATPASVAATSEIALVPSASSSAVAPTSATTESAPVPQEKLEAKTVKIPRDKHVFVLPGAPGTKQVFVYLHGRCGDPLAFMSWATVAWKHGTTVSFEGDEKCDGGRTKWSADTVSLDKRITKALDTVQHELGLAFDADHRLVIGYSAGAIRGEALATRFSERYPRVVLIGGPRAPRPESMRHTEAILLMAGQLDVRKPLSDAADDLVKAGRHARFIMIPHARHGEYGPEAIETMEEALSWVLDGPSGNEPEKTAHASP